MSFAPSIELDSGRILGCFVKVECGNLFEYSKARDTDPLSFPDHPHKVWVGPHDNFRWARVLKTVAYVVVNEADDGTPIVDRWRINHHKEYTKP